MDVDTDESITPFCKGHRCVIFRHALGYSILYSYSFSQIKPSREKKIIYLMIVSLKDLLFTEKGITDYKKDILWIIKD